MKISKFVFTAFRGILLPIFFFAVTMVALQAQPMIVKKTYGGQITGKINIPKSLVSEQQINGSLPELAASIKTYRLIEQRDCDGSYGPLLGPSEKELVPLQATVSLGKSTSKYHVVNYSVGIVSNKPIFVLPGKKQFLDTETPYFVEMNPISVRNKGVWLFGSDLRGLAVAYLTTCDRTFECYDFTGNFIPVPPHFAGN